MYFSVVSCEELVLTFSINKMEPYFAIEKYKIRVKLMYRSQRNRFL